MSKMDKAQTPAVEGFASDWSDFDHEIYADVSRSAKLREMSLVHSEFDVQMKHFWAANDDENGLNSSFNGEFVGCHFDPDAGIVAGGYLWNVDIRRGRYKALKLKTKYVLVYENLEGHEAKYVYYYFEKISRFTSYPYFRSIFATLSSASGLALEPLPSLRERVD